MLNIVNGIQALPEMGLAKPISNIKKLLVQQQGYWAAFYQELPTVIVHVLL